MNKLFVLTLVALVGFASAGPVTNDSVVDEGVGFVPRLPVTNDTFGDEEVGDDISLAAFWADTEDKEVEGVKSPMFTSYCLNARGLTQKFMQGSVNDVATLAFNIMFTNIQELNQKAMEAQAQSVGAVSEEIQKVGLEGEPVDESVEEPVDESVEEPVAESAGELAAKSAEKKKTVVATFLTGVGQVFRAVADRVASDAMTRLNLLMAQINTDNLNGVIHSACDQVTAKLRTQLETVLEKEKDELLEETKGDAEQTSVINGVTFDNVGCVTSSRVASVSNFCQFYKTFGRILMPLLLPKKSE